MPSASLSPHPPPAMPHSPRNATGGGSGGDSAQPVRPPLMKRQSSASSHSSRQAVTSPGSVGDHQQPLRHPVKTRHTKIVLPRNHSSGRNLAKLARQAQNANAHALEDGRKHFRQRSHEGDTEIRLPGSLDESAKPPMRRNMTAYQLPRNTSHAKLKKNLSHGQLTRLGSGKNLAALNTGAQRAPPSPALKGKSRRPKSADLSIVEKQLQEHALEPLRQKQQAQGGRKGAGKKVGFAVGSVDDISDEEDLPDMEGSGLQEDEWTEESASASPYSTRQNTANNSRRTSMTSDRVNEKPAHFAGKSRNTKTTNRRWEGESVPGDPVESESSEPPSPRSRGHDWASHDEQKQPAAEPLRRLNEEPQTKLQEQSSQELSQESSQESSQELEHGQDASRQAEQPLPPQRNVSSQQREHQNPTTRRLLDKGQHLPAPALVSNVSAMDDMHSSRGSPAPSLRSSRSNLVDSAGDALEDELVSRFVPSASHPSVDRSVNTVLSIPRQSGFHTPEEDSTLAAQGRDTHTTGFQVGPVSPGSISGSSGATTPAIQRSRTELRMLQEKAMADLETSADQRPQLPAHVYDRRNESLKSYLNMAGLTDGRGGPMGPDLFQGRFRALNTELRVVQKFRSPLGEAVARLKCCKSSKINQRTSVSKQQTTSLTTSKSAISLPAQRSQDSSDLSKSASPPKSAHSLKKGIAGAQSAVHMPAERQKAKREVSFARAPPETREFESEPVDEELAPDVIARQLWDAI